MTGVPVRLRFLAVLISLALPLVGAGPGWGQNVLAQYPFNEMNCDRVGPGYEATVVDPNALASDVTLSDSLPIVGCYIYQPACCNAYDTLVLRIEVGNTNSDPVFAVLLDKYFQFTVTANPGHVLNLSSLTFDCARGGTSGLPRGWVLLSDVAGFCADPASFIDTQEETTTRHVMSSFSVDLSGAAYQNLTAIT